MFIFSAQNINGIYVDIQFHFCTSVVNSLHLCSNHNNRVGGGGGERRKEMFYLMTHSTHFIYGYMASDIW